MPLTYIVVQYLHGEYVRGYFASKTAIDITVRIGETKILYEQQLMCNFRPGLKMYR